MPLFHVSKCISGEGTWPSASDEVDAQPRDNLEVVVLTLHSRSIGLVVDRILDTVEDAFEVQPVKSRDGVKGTVVVQGKATELLDLDEIIQIANPSLFTQLAAAED
jgi:two-component system chemotaxis sensor kinase CheA